MNPRLKTLIKLLVFLAVTLYLEACLEEKGNKDPNASLISQFADVIKVEVTGKSGNYTFSVTVASPDTGCEQYADWWEVLSAESSNDSSKNSLTGGKLLYRRILRHSHVDEQPFTRSGGSLAIEEDEVVWIRAHMNEVGYGGKAMKGSFKNGFTEMEFPLDFAEGVENESPLPTGCDF